MNLIKQKAYEYALGLGCGLISKAEVFAWCDQVIATLDEPPYESIEISLMSEAKAVDVEGKLKEFAGQQEVEDTVRIVLRELHKRLNEHELTIERGIECTYHLLVYTGLYLDERYYMLYKLDDEYRLARDRITSVDLRAVEESFLEHLGRLLG